ncbi:hypothetical protein ACOSP7_016630 [Xanthoceras sorbifolium]
MDMSSFYEKKTRIIISSPGPRFTERVDMEGVELDVRDTLVCVETVDRPSGVQIMKKIDLQEKSARKWKRVVWA